MRTAIVTLLLGRPYWLAWHELCEPGWRAYADRHDYDIVAIDRPLDTTPRAMARSPAWQKCLVLQPSIAAKYDRIVWLDADIVVNPNAPPIVDGVPVEKIGAIDESVFPTTEENRAFWHRLMAAYRDMPKVVEICRSALNPADWHGFWGLPRRSAHIVQTGVLVLSSPHHRELLEHVYYGYENKNGPALNYEMRPLSFEIQERGLQHWIDPRFNALFNFLLSAANAERRISAQEELFNLIQRTYYANYFLHFAGHQEMLTAAQMALASDGELKRDHPGPSVNGRRGGSFRR
jgi:hypothetical protein